MIKKILFSLMLIALMSFQVTNAQICQPAPQYTQPGIFPDSATGLPCAIVDSLYNVIITAVVPLDTTAEFPQGSGTFVDFWIDSIVLLGMNGLPPGIVVGGCNPASCGFPGGTSGCVKVIGTPSVAGLFNIEFYTRSYVRFKSNGFPVYQDDTTSYYFIQVVNNLVLDTISVTDVTTCGVSSGAIDLSVTGGTGAYTYSWNTTPVQTTQDITGLTAGVYTVTVTDGCFPKTLNVSVTDPGGISVDTASVTHVSVFGDDDGAIDITVTGGTPPYVFSWTGPGGPYSTEDLDTLSAGTYGITVTDNNNCSSSLSIVIGQPTGISEINQRELTIVQNNPNPFTDKTEIIFTAAKAGVVKFKVYNVLGKLVYTENVKANPGINTIEFYSKVLPAGVYMYSLHSDNLIVTKRMVVAEK